MNDENDRIIQYLLEERDTLTKPQAEKLDRLYFCCDLIQKYGSKQKVLRMMQARYKEEHKARGKGYSRKTAMRDYDSTQYVFGATANHSKEFSIELLREKMAQTRQIAILTKNATALTRCDANEIALIEKFFGDKDTPDYGEVRIPDQIFSADPKLLGMEEVDEAKLRKAMAKLLDRPLGELPDIQDAEVING